MTVSREKLYEEVWSEPMVKVAARYGVSSSFLARICARINVPRPSRGYWAQLLVGKAEVVTAAWARPSREPNGPWPASDGDGSMGGALGSPEPLDPRLTLRSPLVGDAAKRI